MTDEEFPKWPELERLGEMPEWLARLDDDAEVQAALGEAIDGLQGAKLSRCAPQARGVDRPLHDCLGR